MTKDVHDAAGKAAAAVHPDLRTACFYARRALQLAVAWIYKHDAALTLPYQDNLSTLIHGADLQAGGDTVGMSRARRMRTAPTMRRLF